jgi:hypothetical protein
VSTDDGVYELPLSDGLGLNRVPAGPPISARPLKTVRHAGNLVFRGGVVRAERLLRFQRFPHKNWGLLSRCTVRRASPTLWQRSPGSGSRARAPLPICTGPTSGSRTIVEAALSESGRKTIARGRPGPAGLAVDTGRPWDRSSRRSTNGVPELARSTQLRRHRAVPGGLHRRT